MKVIGSYTQALFATAQFQMANLYSFALVTGTTLNYCSGDIDILLNTSAATSDVAAYWANQTFTCGRTASGPFLDTSANKFKLQQQRGLQVNTLTFDALPGAAIVQGTGFLQAVRQGVFDGAVLTVYGAYWPKQGFVNPVVPTGCIIKFVGRIAEVDASNNKVTFTANSHTELLNQNMPRNLWQQMCVNTLYDTSCTLNPNSFKESSSAASGSTASSINATLTGATGIYSLGKITFTSGALNGVSRGVKANVHGSPSTVSLMIPFPVAPAPGDTFNIFQGCNKLQATCQNKFSNLANFRGFPDIPINETAA